MFTEATPFADSVKSHPQASDSFNWTLHNRNCEVVIKSLVLIAWSGEQRGCDGNGACGSVDTSGRPQACHLRRGIVASRKRRALLGVRSLSMHHLLPCAPYRRRRSHARSLRLLIFFQTQQSGSNALQRKIWPHYHGFVLQTVLA